MFCKGEMTIKHESLRDCSRQQLEFPAHDNLSCSNPCSCKTPSEHDHSRCEAHGAAQPCHERPAATDSDSSMIRIGCFRTGVSSSWSFAARYTASRNVRAKTRCMRQAS